MPKSTSHHPGMYPRRIQARGGSFDEQRYFSTIVASIAAQHAGEEKRTEDPLTPATQGVQR
jgi:hypothetical protein